MFQIRFHFSVLVLALVWGRICKYAPVIVILASLVKNVENDAARAALHGIVAAALTQLAGGNGADGLKAGAAGAVTASLLSERLVSNLVSIAGAGVGYAAGGEDVSLAAVGANTAWVEAENNSLSLVARGCAVAAPCRTKVAEQLLEIGAKAGMVGLAGAAIKDMADKMTSDELDHLVTLQMMGNDEIIGKYLSSLQDKYGSGSESAPNMGKNQTDAEKAELGGAGSGTRGGWEPQDEENGRDK